jgi:N-acetylglucosamine-6-sulfatase
VRFLVALAALAGACLCLPIASAPAAERPNFVHILTDDQTVDSLPYMPRTQLVLGAGGTTFTNYHAVQPLCCPSRASFLTGQYPHNHGVLNNLPPFGYDRLNFKRTIYTALDREGYRTGWIGKLLNDPDAHGIQPEPGFDEWFIPLGQSELFMSEFTVSDNGFVREFTDTFQTRLYAERTRDFLSATNRAPFMLTISLSSPHWNRCASGEVGVHCPPEPDPVDLGSFSRSTFPIEDPSMDAAERAVADEYWQRELESLQSVDRMVLHVFDLLREAGELDNTYVIYQSDNGLMHGEHDVPFDKNVPWDRSVRVPLLISGPGFKRGTIRDDLTANVDVAATILDAAEVDPPRPQDGYSLLTKHRRRFLLLERLIGSAGPSMDQPWRQIKTASGWTYWRELRP